jgi:hypothetical protein
MALEFTPEDLLIFCSIYFGMLFIVPMYRRMKSIPSESCRDCAKKCAIDDRRICRITRMEIVDDDDWCSAYEKEQR